MTRVIGFFGVVLMLLAGTLVVARRDEPEQWIAFISDRDGNAEIYRMRPDGSGVQQLTQTPNDIVHCWIKWSRRGDWLYYGRDHLNMALGGPFECSYSHGAVEHFRIAVDGTSRQPIVRKYINSVSPNGRWFVATDWQYGTNLLYRVRPNGSQRLLLGEAFFSSWSRNSKWVAIWAYDTKVQLVRIDRKQNMNLDLSDLGFRGFASLFFDLSGEAIIFHGYSESEEVQPSGLYRLNLDSGELQKVGGVDRGIACFEPDFAQPSFSPNGLWLACADSVLSTLNMETNVAVRLVETEFPDNYSAYTTGRFSWSPDSQWIVFSKFDEAGRSKIWRIHPDGTGLEQLTFGLGEDLRPAWSPVMDKAWDGWGLMGIGAGVVTTMWLIVRWREQSGYVTVRDDYPMCGRPSDPTKNQPVRACQALATFLKCR